MQYEISIYSGLKVMTKVKVSVHASHTDVDMDTYARAMTFAPHTYLSQCDHYNNGGPYLYQKV